MRRGTNKSGGSGRCSLPDAALIATSHEVTADKNTSLRESAITSRALREIRDGLPTLQSQTPVSSRYFNASSSLSCGLEHWSAARHRTRLQVLCREHRNLPRSRSCPHPCP